MNVELCLQEYKSNEYVILLNPQNERWVKVRRNFYENMDEVAIRSLAIKYGLNKSILQDNKVSSIYLFMTHHCNLACNYCFLKCNPNIEVEKEFDCNKVMQFISQIPISERTKLVITGGEPLSKTDLKDILMHLQKYIKKERIILQTNGLLLTDEKIDEIKEYVCCVEMSIDNVVVNKELKSKMEKKYSKLKNEGCQIAFSFVADNFNIDYLIDAVELADKYDAFFQVRFVEPIGNGEQGSLEQWEQQYHLMKKSFIKLSEYIIKHNGFKNKYASIMNTALIPRNRCGGYKEVIAIHPNGDAFPCGNITNPELLLANLEDDDFLDKAKKLYSQDATKSRFLVDCKKECLSCEYLYFCNGVCGAIDKNFKYYEEYRNSTCKFKKELLYFLMFLNNNSWTNEEYYLNFKGYLERKNYESVVERNVKKINI